MTGGGREGVACISGPIRRTAGTGIGARISAGQTHLVVEQGLAHGPGGADRRSSGRRGGLLVGHCGVGEGGESAIASRSVARELLGRAGGWEGWC